MMSSPDFDDVAHFQRDPDLAEVGRPGRAQLSDYVRKFEEAGRRRKRWLAIEQAWILVFTAAAIVLIASDNGTARLAGGICGLLAAPCWLRCTWSARQLGMFALSLWFLAVYLAVVARHL